MSFAALFILILERVVYVKIHTQNASPYWILIEMGIDFAQLGDRFTA